MRYSSFATVVLFWGFAMLGISQQSVITVDSAQAVVRVPDTFVPPKMSVEDSTAMAKKFKVGVHQISFFVGGGLGSFLYSPEYGSKSNGFGFTTGFDYTYYWNPKWGINSGLIIDSYSSSLDLNGVETSTKSMDGDLDNDGTPEEFYLISNFNSFVEKQKSLTLGIPIEVRFRHAFTPKVGMIAGLGPKLVFALSNTSQVSQGSYTTKGYYPQYGSGAYTEIGPGFDTYQPRNKVSTDYGFGVSMIGEYLVTYKINLAFTLYGGPYFEYQLNSQKGSADKPLVEYQVTGPDAANSNYNPVMTTSSADKINRMAVGGKIGVIFDIGGNKMMRQMKRDYNDAIAAEQARLEALARQKAYDDSVANALYLAELRNKQIADSIANAQRLADEAARLALLAKLAEEQRIKDSIANAKEVAVIMDIKTKTLSDDELALLKLPIIFAKGSADITDQSKINAQRIGAMLAKHPDLLFRITGHTCDLGDDKVNYRLGLRRAETLFREFSSAGVKTTQISTFSKGELEPLYPNINEDNRRRNRRVVVVIEDEVKKSTEEQVYR